MKWISSSPLLHPGYFFRETESESAPRAVTPAKAASEAEIKSLRVTVFLLFL
jgi:hypothetical protein